MNQNELMSVDEKEKETGHSELFPTTNKKK